MIGLITAQLVFLSLALLAAKMRHVQMSAKGHIGLAALAIALGLLGLLAVLPPLWRAASDPIKRSYLSWAPNENGDLGWWLVASLAAGIVEEVVYRGVMLAFALRITGHWWSAVLICVVVFAAGHAAQGWKALVVIALMGFGFHVLVRLTGNLYLAMAVHSVYDFLGGIIFIRVAREWKNLPDRSVQIEQEPA